MEKVRSPQCKYCPEEDNVYHIFLCVGLFAEERGMLLSNVVVVTPYSIADVMLHSEDAGGVENKCLLRSRNSSWEVREGMTG